MDDREIDHIFSSYPLSKVELSVEKLSEISRYSDHKPLLYQFEGRLTQTKSLVPNRSFCDEVVTRILKAKTARINS